MKLLSFIAACICTTAAFAQDTIVTRKGEKIPALVSTISTTEVEYRKANNPTGPIYRHNKQDVYAIYYKNGTSDVFANNTPVPAPAPTPAAGTTSAKTRTDVKIASTITFFGLDFSNFYLVEPKRMGEGQMIRDRHFPEWNTYFAKEIDNNRLRHWLRKGAVNYEMSAVQELNASADPSRVVRAEVDYTPFNSKIPAAVATLKISNPAATGIGMVINVAYFDKRKNETSLYYTFFDIETRAIIASDHVLLKEGGGAGLTTYWGTGIVANTRYFIDHIYRRY